MVHEQIQAILLTRGNTGVPLVDYEITDNRDGLGPRITRWTVATLGGQPTPAELAAVTPAQLAAVAAAVLDALATLELDRKDLRAAILALWEAIPSPLLTKVQLRARAIAIRKTL
jgi:hypothetical protein